MANGIGPQRTDFTQVARRLRCASLGSSRVVDIDISEPVPTEKSIWHAQHGLNGVDHRLALWPWGNRRHHSNAEHRRRCGPD
jgi:hypothetical protein